MLDDFEMDWQATQPSSLQSGPYIPDAAECMRCGMCLGYCPTYKIEPIEAESPRGRVATLRSWLHEDRQPEPSQIEHLENCLQCRTCETVCPSKVNYGGLYDQASARLHIQRQSGWLERLAFVLVENKRLRQLFLPWVALYTNSFLQPWLRRSGWLPKFGLQAAEALAQTPALTELAQYYSPKSGKRRGRVALFTGCLGEAFDRATLTASIQLLNRFGFEVVVPSQQVCCGALHQHHGRSPQTLMERNLRTFYALEVSAVIYCASGCGAMLASYRSEDNEVAGWFCSHLYDISEFLLAHWPGDLKPATSRLRVAVHEPCSQRNLLHNADAVYQLLDHIPGVEVVASVDNATCCGAGGSYLLTHPEKAAQLRALKQQALEQTQADLLVTSNFGCALHLNQSLAAGQLKLLHPVQLLVDRI